MLLDKIKSSYLLGYIDIHNPEKKLIDGKKLFPDNLRSSTTIKSLKIWFGSHPGGSVKSLLGIKIKYINYITGEKKETDYQGAKIEGMDVEVKELEIKEGDHLSKINIGFDDYITHIKFATIKGKFIEFGIIIEDNEKQFVNELNSRDNIILNLKGYSDQNGIRAIGYDYLSFKDFCLIRWINLLRIRNYMKNEKYLQNLQNEYTKFDIGMKSIFKTCRLPQSCFSIILSFI